MLTMLYNMEKHFLSLLVGLEQNSLKSTSADSIHLVGNEYAEEGSNLELLCELTNITNLIIVYKSERSTVNSSEKHLTLCLLDSHIPLCSTPSVGRYSFSAERSSVQISIMNATRTEDQLYWSCLEPGTGHGTVLYLNIFTTPNSIDLRTDPVQGSYDLSIESVKLTCTVTCVYPAPTFLWYSTKLGSQRRILHINTTLTSQSSNCRDSFEKTFISTLSLLNLTTFGNNEDSTVAIECGIDFETLQSPLFSTSSPLITFAVANTNVTLTYGSGEIPSSSDVIVTLGINTNLTCDHSASRTRPTIIWYIGSRQVSRSTETIYTYIPVEQDHGQPVYCKAFNTHAESQAISSLIYKLYIQVPPKVQVSFSMEEEVGEYSPLNIGCSAVGRPENISFEPIKHFWQNIELPILHPFENLSIKIQAVQLQDSGTYTCRASNGVIDRNGVLYQESSGDVKVKVAPKIVSSTLKYYASLEESMEMKLRYYSHPSNSTVKLLRENGDLKSNGSRHGLTRSSVQVATKFLGKNITLNGFEISYKVERIQKEDFGRYIFVLANGIGSTEQIMSLNEKVKPEPARNFTIVGYLQRQPMFSWESSFNGGSPQMFVIEVAKENTEDWTEVLSITENIDQNECSSKRIYIERAPDFAAGIYITRLKSINVVGATEAVSNSLVKFEIEAQGDESHTQTAAVIGGTLGCTNLIFIISLIVTHMRRSKCAKIQSAGKEPQQASLDLEGDGMPYDTLQHGGDNETYEQMTSSFEIYENTAITTSAI